MSSVETFLAYSSLPRPLWRCRKYIELIEEMEIYAAIHPAFPKFMASVFFLSI